MTDPSNSEPAKCFNCDEACGEDNLCDGCEKYVCEGCDVNYDMPFGAHDAGLHLEEPEE